MLETFYEQIREFGVQIDSQHINSTEIVETYIVFGTRVDAYVISGNPRTIIVSD